MRIWKIGAVLLIFLLLLSYYLIYEKKEKTAKEERLFDLTWEKIESIDIESGKERIRLRREGDSWRITDPVNAMADGEVVADLLTTMKLMAVKKVVDEKGENRSYYRLDEPQGRIKLNMGKDSAIELRIGKRSPVGYSVYVMRGDQGRIVLVEAGIEQYIRKRPQDWREKRLLLLKEKDIESIKIKGQHGRVLLERKGDEWELVYPIRERVDREEVFSYIYRVGGIRAVEYPGISMKEAALDRPGLEIEIGLKNGEKKHLVMARKGKRVYAALREKGEVVRVEEGSWNDAAKRAIDFRNRRIFDLDPARIRSIEIVKGYGKIVVKKDGEGWKIVSPSQGDADEGKVSAFIFRLKGWKADDIVDNPVGLEKYGISDRSLRAIFHVDGGDQAVILSIGNPLDKGKVYVWTNREKDKLFIADKRVEDVFPKNPEEWMKGARNDKNR